MAEYGSMLAVSLLASILFLGGWNGPIPIASLLGLTFEHGFWYGFAGNVLGTLNMLMQGRDRRDGDDVGPLDAAAAADRPGDHDLLEILRADRGGDVPGRDAVAILLAGRTDSSASRAVGRIASANYGRSRQPPPSRKPEPPSDRPAGDDATARRRDIGQDG